MTQNKIRSILTLITLGLVAVVLSPICTGCGSAYPIIQVSGASDSADKALERELHEAALAEGGRVRHIVLIPAGRAKTDGVDYITAQLQVRCWGSNDEIKVEAPARLMRRNEFISWAQLQSHEVCNPLDRPPTDFDERF